jgi:hypothetical protein
MKALRLRPRATLPHAIESPRLAFLNGWWSGIGVGFISGIAMAVIAKGVM